MRGYYSAMQQAKSAVAKGKRRSQENTLPEQDINQNIALPFTKHFSYAFISFIFN
jgi:hypothetical protein